MTAASRMRTALIGAVSVSCAALASAPRGVEPPAEGLPHLRFDAGAKRVEIDAKVSLEFNDPPGAKIYLEQVACIPDTKEHEVLLVTRAKPSHVHAALLAIGLEPGKPATWTQEGGKVIPHPPQGSKVRVEFVFDDDAGNEVVKTPADWVVNARNGEAWPEGEFVFAGSVVRERDGRANYLADIEGTLIGLTSFGTEVVAWPRVISPDSQIDEPEWIARGAAIPRMGTPVVIRLTAVE